jgi:hypothetical protein
MSQPTERESLLERAKLMNLDFKKNIPTDKLRDLVNGKIEGKKEVVDVEIKSTGKVKEKTEKEIVGESITSLRKQLTKLRRVVVTCNDPGMIDYDMTPYYQVSNSVITLPKVTIPLNVEWHIPQAYYDMLKTMTCTIPTKGKDAKGRPITVPKEIKKYGIQDLPDLTAEELEDLKKAQITRDGVAKA